MGIQVKCAKCGKVLSVSEKHAGRRGKCPACSAPFVVPEPPPPAPPTAGKSVTFEVKRVLSGLPPKKIPAVLTLTREELSSAATFACPGRTPLSSPACWRSLEPERAC